MSGVRPFELLACGLACGLAVAAIAGTHPDTHSPRVLDDFEHLERWSVHPSDGVTAKISPAPGKVGRAMRIDFDFHGHAGYAIVRRALDLDLPANYVFASWVRGAAPDENLEFKLIDSTNENVWWNNARDVRFSSTWRRLVRRRKDITFAWGPKGGGELHHAAYLEISITAGSRGGGHGTVWLDELTFEELPPQAVEPPTLADEPNEYFMMLAAHAPRGSYPRGFSGEQAYWTVIGVPGDDVQALVSGDGAVEPFRGGFSIEPFLRIGDSVITWADASTRQSLAERDLPIPSVEWTRGDVHLSVTAAAIGVPGQSSALMRYRVANHASTSRAVTLYVAARPFQVNPPTQFLGLPGGSALVTRARWSAGELHITDDPRDGERRVVPITKPQSAGVAPFREQSIVERLRAGKVPARIDVSDTAEHAAAVLTYPLSLGAGQARDVYVEIPLHPGGRASHLVADAAAAEAAFARSEHEWAARLDRVTFTLPPEASRIAESIRSNLAWILIERSGDALRPGTRAYARSWIRDGALMAAALDRLGYADLSRRFALWYAPYQFANGKVPCCVDERGADPVDENDSHGELIYLIAEYWRFTGDTATVARLWPHIERDVAYIDSLRHLRLTPAYDTGTMLAFRGLLPQSISHEGYSAKPMHSYWDDLFALRGLTDAAELAAALHRVVEERRFASIRDAFHADLVASIQRAMAEHHIEYVPGSVELGDFDPTSTTVFVAPGRELGGPLDAALRRTFDRYWSTFETRRASNTWDAYTPYELRTVGTFVRLGEPERARAVLDFLFEGQRPSTWRQWAEVVGRDSAAPRFIGDMPHAWVGSDFLRSAMDLFAYERAPDSALVLAAGIPHSWVASREGVGVRGLGTYYGPLTYSLIARGDTVRLHVGGGLRLPAAGIVFRSPLDRPLVSATIDGVPAAIHDGEIVVHHVPANVVILHRHP